MDWRRWFIVGGIFTLALGKVADAVKDPFHPGKQPHVDLRGLYQRITTTANLNVVGSGTNTSITPPTGTLILEGQDAVVVGLSDRAHIEKIER